MKKLIILTAMIIIVSACGQKQGGPEKPVVLDKLFRLSSGPCVTALFPFDVKYEDRQVKKLSNVTAVMHSLSSKNYNVRVSVLTTDNGYFRDKPLSRVYGDSNLLYSRHDTIDHPERSAAVYVISSGEKCLVMKGRIQHRLSNFQMVDIDFRKVLPVSADMSAEAAEMRGIINSVYGRMSVTECTEKKNTEE